MYRHQFVIVLIFYSSKYNKDGSDVDWSNGMADEIGIRVTYYAWKRRIALIVYQYMQMLFKNVNHFIKQSGTFRNFNGNTSVLLTIS